MRPMQGRGGASRWNTRATLHKDREEVGLVDGTRALHKDREGVGLVDGTCALLREGVGLVDGTCALHKEEGGAGTRRRWS